MKERLTKLIKEAQERYIYAEEQAQYLMENGVDCVKHGEWKPMMSVCNRGMCSVCDEVGAIRWNYCPNCGAKMKGGEGK